MRRLLTACLLLWATQVVGQGVFIARIVPGNYLSDNRHRVEFFNPEAQLQSLEGYMLVTRDYSVRLPAEARVPGHGRLVLAKNKAAGVDISLSTTPDFLIRFPTVEHEGNYLVLFDPKGKVLEALYYSPVPNVPFLPDRDTLFTYSREKLPYYIPPENRPVWSHFTLGGDPQATFVKTAGVWRISSARDNPATDYQTVTLRYKEGIMSLRWTVAYEKDSRLHIVERSTDIERFQPMDTIAALGDTKVPRTYDYYEEGLQSGATYYYRIRNIDAAGREVYSRIREVKAEEGQEEFSLEVLQGHTGGSPLRLRFNSLYSQQVRIKLYDERRMEVAILYDDFVYAGVPGLLKVGRQLPPGNYLILAETESKRFGQTFDVKE